MSVKTLEIDTPFGTAKAHLTEADEPRAALVLGHGAGGGVQAKDLVAVANLEDDSALQLVLPLDRFSGTALDVAIDEVRRRFGSTAVTRAVLLGREQGFTVPLLPD